LRRKPIINQRAIGTGLKSSTAVYSITGRLDLNPLKKKVALPFPKKGDTNLSL
jgi:hypothetical protein